MSSEYERTIPIKYILNISIGIIFHTEDFKDKIFKEILSQVPRECLDSYSYSQDFIQLKTGVKIHFINEYSIGNRRGLRFDRVFYERKPLKLESLGIIMAQMTSRFSSPMKIEI